MLYIDTPRLQLRDWIDQDIEPFIQLNADEQVMKYFPKPLTKDETIARQKDIAADIKQNGFGLYAVELKENQEFIGCIGFHRATFQADFTPCIEIGWRLKKEAWGNGYATEGALACLDYGFNELGLQDIYSFTADINQPSKNVMIRIGMTFLNTFNHPNIEMNHPLSKHVLYHMNKEKLL